MKNKLLVLLLLAGLVLKAQETEDKRTRNKQYERPIAFDLRIGPVGFFSVHMIEVVPSLAGFPKQIYNVPTVHNNFGGLHLGVGVAIKKQFHLDAIAGFESKSQTTPIPLGVSGHINLLKSRFSPFVQFEGGYLGWYVHPSSTPVHFYNGAFATAGIGFYARITKFFAIAIAPEYRFVYFGIPIIVTDISGHFIRTDEIKNYVHQIGFHLTFIFY